MSKICVLTSAMGVSDTMVREVAGQVPDSTTPKRLSDVAVEFAFDGENPTVDLPQVDINIVPTQNRRKKLLIADMDSTMIPVECIDELADFAGVKERVADITERAMRGELDFEAAIDERVGLLAGLSEDVLQRCYDERITLNPGAAVLVRTMNALGAMTALVSGGFDFFTSRVGTDAGFQVNQANHLLIDAGKLTGQVQKPVLGQQAKLDALHQLCTNGGYGPADVLAVGDGANDRAMVEVAGLGVAYHAKPALAAVATAQLYHSDLTALLSLQGIPESKFATI